MGSKRWSETTSESPSCRFQIGRVVPGAAAAAVTATAAMTFGYTANKFRGTIENKENKNVLR